MLFSREQIYVFKKKICKKFELFSELMGQLTPQPSSSNHTGVGEIGTSRYV